MNIKEIKELIEMMNNSDLTGFEYENSGVRLVLKKEIQVISSSTAHMVPVQQSAAVHENKEPASAEIPVGEGVQEITSPIVGTYYAASSPGSKPFVEVGDKVKKGQVLCIVEAMKLMNEITADFDCEIVKVLVKNEDIVQYGQPLFLVKVI